MLVSSPEILVFLFFMITDPKTIPDGALRAPRVRGESRSWPRLLIAPQETEFATKVALLGALTLACAARPLLVLAGSDRLDRSQRGCARARASRAVGAAATAALASRPSSSLAGLPARSGAASAAQPRADAVTLPQVTVAPAQGSPPLDQATALRIARDLVADLATRAEALRTRDLETGGAAAGRWLADLWQRIRAAQGGDRRPDLRRGPDAAQLERGKGQGAAVVARLSGKPLLDATAPRRRSCGRSVPRDVVRTLEVVPSTAAVTSSRARPRRRRARRRRPPRHRDSRRSGG